jgi:hypothetical protein
VDRRIAASDYGSPEFLYAIRLYHSAKWRRMRRRHLKQHPLCEICLEDDVVEPANVVHHRERHDGDEAKFFDEGLLQSLCREHQRVARGAAV